MANESGEIKVVGSEGFDYQFIDKEKFLLGFRDPLWHLKFIEFEEVQESFYGANEDLQTIHSWSDEKRKRRRNLRKEIYSVVLEAFIRGEIAFGDSGKNWDKDRKPIDTVVIHCHESENFTHDGMFSVVPLVRLYIPSYAKARSDSEHYRKPIWSNHFDAQNKMNFWAYHHVIRNEGGTQRFLEDDQIGWQAGNWDVNSRSVGVCIPSNFAQDEPTEEILDLIAKVIKENYPHVSKSNIIGHLEVPRDQRHSHRIWCPGKLFLDGWKPRLLKRI